MAEHGDSGGGGTGAAFPLIFFGVLFAFWLITGAGEGPGIFGGNATTTPPEPATTTPTYLEASPEYDYEELVPSRR